MNASNPVPQDPWSIPIDQIDVSQAALYQQNRHGPYFARLRAECPVHYCADSAFGPYWSITKFRDIVNIESDPKRFSSARDIVIGDQPDDFSPTSFIQKDDPDHMTERRVVQDAVAPRRLADLEVLIRTRVAEIMDSLPVDEPFNWVELVSKELTSQMLATLFDVPFEDRHLLPYWSDIMTASEMGGTEGVDEARRREVLQECLDYFSKLWRDRASQPQQMDFVSLLAHGVDTKSMIDRPLDLLGTLMLLVIGGNDTTRNSLSGGVVFLNQFPDEYKKLSNNPSLVASMVPEIIRYQTPLAHMRRTATEDVDIGGQTIRTGDKVVMWYVSGNRDEEVIEQPDAFLIDRKNPRHHLSFGFGIHRCMGNRVGELQLRIVWEEILKRFERVELVGEPERVPSNFVLGYTNVPVQIHPARS